MRALESDNCACRATLRMRESVRSYFRDTPRFDSGHTGHVGSGKRTYRRSRHRLRTSDTVSQTGRNGRGKKEEREGMRTAANLFHVDGSHCYTKRATIANYLRQRRGWRRRAADGRVGRGTSPRREGLVPLSYVSSGFQTCHPSALILSSFRPINLSLRFLPHNETIKSSNGPPRTHKIVVFYLNQVIKWVYKVAHRSINMRT